VGSLDESFIYGSGFNAIVNTIQIQSDGKILVGGEFTEYDGIPSNYIIRLNSDGSIDNTFDIGDGFDGTVRTISIQSDGKILVGGGFATYNGTPSNYIIRLNSDGSIDNTFDIGEGFDNTVNTIQIQSDGKILIGGVFSSYDGIPANRIIRLNSDGSIDDTFVIGEGFDNWVYTIQIQIDGKILVGGIFTSYDNTNAFYIVRLNSDGSIDDTFVIGGGFNGGVRTIEIQSDSKILVGGDFTEYDGTPSNYFIRLNSDGSIDNTFVIGTGFDNWVYTIQIQIDGKILVGGNFSSYDGILSKFIIRLNSDGSIDNTFVVGTGFNNTVLTMLIKDNGTLLIGGGFSSYKQTTINKIIRLNTSGLYDGSLFYNVGFDNEVFTIALQSDGKILVGGGFTSYDGTFSNNIIRLNSDGSIDNTFVIGGGFNGQVNTIQIQSDGKILIGGGFSEYDTAPSSGIIRLNSDGSVDNTFVVGDGFNNVVYTIEIQSDGKILVGGNFLNYDGTSSNNIIRLNSDGSIDNTFVIGGGFDGAVNTIVLQSDEKILVGGDFSNYDSITSKKIIRLNSDGSIDNTFVIGSGFSDSVRTIAVQSNGKILIGGSFTDYDSIPANYIIRLNSDGSVDNTFVNNAGFSNQVFTIQIQSDGKILVGGSFGTYDETPSNYFIRLNSDGSIDDTFVIGNGFNDSVYTIQIQSDGKILVGGNFSSYPLNNGVFQLSDGSCVLLESYGVVSRNQPERLITFGPFLSCIECSTPDDSAGVESIICISCDDVYSVTATTVPHAIYLNNQGRAIFQINTVAIGGFNGLNN
jgi:uncharacterized delta-60 repeat protein